MKISVITTCLNAEATISDTIESVVASGFADVEHLIIDAGSTDGTLAILERYPHLIVNIELRASIARAWNIGIARATGDAILLLNADDYVDTDALKIASEALARCGEPAIVVGNVEVIDSAGQVLRTVRGRLPKWTNVYRGLPFLHPSAIVSRSLYDTVGHFDERYRVGLDADWLIRAYTKNVRFISAPHHVYMRAGGLSDARRWVGFGEYLETLERANVGTPTMVAALLNRAAVLVKNRLFRSIGATIRRVGRSGAAP